MKRSRILEIGILLLILGLVIIFPVSMNIAHADSINQPNLQAIDAFLQEQVKANRIPGVAVGIVQGDKVIFLKGYGEAGAGKPVTPQTQFYLGSTTKSFTALASMNLVEKGKLDLDTPVQKYIPWFKVTDPQASASITVRNLLNHTSGLSEKGDRNANAYTASLEEQALLLKDVRLISPVGSKFEYYNQNYRLAGVIIEKVSGQSYGEFLQEQVFAPLGMTNSTAAPLDATNLSLGYSRFFGFPLPRSQRFIPGALPSGYLITTAEDMTAFLKAQINNQLPDGSQMLRPDLLAQMRTPPPGIGSEYGMGWMVMENGNTLAHGGALENFQSFMVIGVKEKTGLIILYNQNSMENMLFENNTIREGLLNLLNGKAAPTTNYNWIGWLLLVLAIADSLNHIRLYRMLHNWLQKTANQSRTWLWVKVSIGILIPLAVIFGLPVLVNILEGGSPSWAEPFGLMPDITAWLLLGMGLNLVRSLIHAVSLVRNTK